MPLPFKIAAIDLDGTLLGPDHLVSARNARAVRALASRGVVCVLASGRMHQATVRFADQLDLVGPVISYNGAVVRDLLSGDTWLHERTPAEPAEEIVRYCAINGHHLNYYLDDHLYVAERTRWAEFYLSQTGSPMEVVGDLGQFAGSRPTKMILIDTPDTTDFLMNLFVRRFGSSLYITKTNREYLEFMHPSANKGAALELVARRLGVPQAEVIAFGDGRNDIPMLNWAGMSVAMEGDISVMSEADYVAPLCDEQGFDIEDGFGSYVEWLLAEGG